MELEIIMLSEISQTQNDSVTCLLSREEPRLREEKVMEAEGELFGKRKRTRGRRDREDWREGGM
jgi:hypothetical protein